MEKLMTVVKVYQVKDELAGNGRSLLSEIGWGEIPIDFVCNHVFVAEIETEVEGLGALDEAYRLTQNIDIPWVLAGHPGLRVVGYPKGRRSSHIGDVLVIGEDAYVCVPVGWEKIVSVDQKVRRG